MRMSSWNAHMGRGAFTKLRDVDTFYVDMGRGDPLLLIHGWGSSSFSWRRNYPVLADFFRVLAVDLPGFGLSKSLPSGLHLDAVSSHLFGLLGQLGVDEVSLVGHSMGGPIAAYMAAHQPERVSKLVLISPSLLGGRSGRRPPFVELARNRFLSSLLVRLILNRSFVRRTLRGAYFNRNLVDGDTVEGYYQSVINSGPTLLQAFNIMDEFSPDILHQIRCKTLFILGDNDKWVPAEENRLIAEKVNARLAIISEAGHIPQEEKPQEINKILVEFLSSTD